MHQPDQDCEARADSGDASPELIPLAWEVPEARAWIPDDLKMVIEAPTHLLRVRFDVDAKQRRKHRDVLDIYQNLSSYLEGWRYVRHQDLSESRPDVGERWQIVCFVGQPTEPNPPPLLIVVGIRHSVPYLATVHRRTERWMQAFLERDDVRERGK